MKVAICLVNLSSPFLHLQLKKKERSGRGGGGEEPLSEFSSSYPAPSPNKTATQAMMLPEPAITTEDVRTCVKLQRLRKSTSIIQIGLTKSWQLHIMINLQVHTDHIKEYLL